MTKDTEDMINHPAHYTQEGIECIDCIGAVASSYSGEAAVCVGNIVKYLYRSKHKNGLEDLQKAKWYMDRLVEKTKERRLYPARRQDKVVHDRLAEETEDGDVS